LLYLDKTVIDIPAKVTALHTGFKGFTNSHTLLATFVELETLIARSMRALRVAINHDGDNLIVREPTLTTATATLCLLLLLRLSCLCGLFGLGLFLRLCSLGSLCLALLNRLILLFDRLCPATSLFLSCLWFSF